MIRRSSLAGGLLMSFGMAGAAVAQIDPVGVQLVGQWDEHPAEHVAADVWADQRGYAYVGNAAGASVDIMDIRNPSNPSLVTTYLIPAPNDAARTEDVKEFGGLLFIGLDGDGEDGLQIVDVRDPALPVFLANVTVPGFEDVHNSFFASGFLYLANGNDANVAIVDLRDLSPDDPPAETVRDAKWVIGPVGTDRVADVTVVGDRLYVAAGDGGVWIYDIDNVENMAPTLFAWAAGSDTNSAWPSADRRWVVTNERRADEGPIKLYELIERPGFVALAHRSTVRIPIDQAPSSHNVYVAGLRVYCAWYNRGLMVFDIDPATFDLDLVAHFDTSTSTTAFEGAWGAFPFLGPDRILVSDTNTQFWVLSVEVPLPGDADTDGDRDMADWAALQVCFSGRDVPHAGGMCETLNFDGDQDVDVDDANLYGSHLTGPH